MASPVDLRDVSHLNHFIRDAATEIGKQLDPEEDWAPVAFVVTPANEFGIVHTDGWENDEQRQRYIRAIADRIMRRKAVTVGMVSMIWMLRSDLSRMEREPRPRDNPMRQEALYVASYSADEDLVAVATVTRSPTNPPMLGEWQTWSEQEGATATPIKEALRKVRDA